MATLQAALKRGIEQCFQIEESGPATTPQSAQEWQKAI